MDLIVVLISFDIVASKFLDSYINSYRAVGLYEERNPVLRKLLSLLRIENDVWLSFFFTILMVGTAVFFLTTYYATTPYQLLFVVTGLFTTALNLGSAHSAYFGKRNFITRRLLQGRKVEI